VQQLIVDKAQYRGHRDCGTLVCFVYDPDRRLPNAAAIESDLSGQDGGLTTIVVVSPRGLLPIRGLGGLLSMVIRRQPSYGPELSTVTRWEGPAGAAYSSSFSLARRSVVAGNRWW
jgi:hypothetical protein